MPSTYDEKKKCRVGTMDEKQFYSESSELNGAYFISLIAAWKKAGGSLKWGAGGAGLRGDVGGKEVGVCFLAPAYANKKDRIELSLTPLAKQIGEARCRQLKESLHGTAGERLKGASMISILEPGELSASARKSLTKALCDVIG